MHHRLFSAFHAVFVFLPNSIIFSQFCEAFDRSLPGLSLNSKMFGLPFCLILNRSFCLKLEVYFFFILKSTSLTNLFPSIFFGLSWEQSMELHRLFFIIIPFVLRFSFLISFKSNIDSSCYTRFAAD